LASAAKAIDDLQRRRDNIQTEGQMTFEDGMIGCSYTQLAMYALYYAKPEEKQKYLDAALFLLKAHRCLSQLIIPDCRMNGASLRFWESQYDILTPPNMMNSPHGWSGWRVYGLWYLYQLTGREDYLRQVQNAMGTCCQLIDFKTGELRWAFISDPYINANEWIEDKDNPGKGIARNRIIGEQYMPMISGWYKARPSKYMFAYGRKQDGGCCDNDVHEIFKCLEETALTSAYVVERENGQLVGYNCKVVMKDDTLVVTPHESIVNSVHFNLKKGKNSAIEFLNGKTLSKSISAGLHWVGKQD
jgi:hypothetical protein